MPGYSLQNGKTTIRLQKAEPNNETPQLPVVMAHYFYPFGVGFFVCAPSTCIWVVAVMDRPAP